MKIDYQLPPIELLDAPVVSVGESQPSIEANQGKPQAKISIRSIMESKEWNATDIGIPVILGEDRSGKPVVVDLSRAPHLLIAGATGTGTTLCVHSLILSLLSSFTPDELNLLMVDPKTVDFTYYASLPHLISPIITDVDKTPAELRLLVEEMERRYRLFSKVGSINISEFNSRKKLAVTELDDEGKEIPYKIPKIVIIINELADIMVSDARCEVEISIARIAQKGRAAGIHMIIATQTPRVNVITSVIKANMPTRIAFNVTSNVDSRVILDMGGAEDLIGRGDMLFLATDSSDFRRIQGAWVSEKEIEKVVKFISRQTSEKVVEILKNNLDKLKIKLRTFAAERNWERFHSPKNLSMALNVEAAELLEIFQWLTEDESLSMPASKLNHAREEIGDILNYTVRLADKLGIDPLEAAFDKIEKKNRMYPVAEDMEISRG